MIQYYGNTESHQYEADESEVWRQHQMERHSQDRGNWWTFAKKREVRRWWLTLVTGINCGLVAMFVTVCTRSVTSAKLEYFSGLIEQEKAEIVPYGAALCALWIMNIIFISIAWFCVYLEPLASGSGIPEIKCFLNGCNIPRVVRIRTLVCKVFGIIFACSAGLPLGKEGPMVHAGAVIAAVISEGKETILHGLNPNFSTFQDFRNDREKRDFVACGSAAGVAAAFGSPIGGVLFSLEEGASFWSTRLTWRCFFCAMTTMFTLFMVKTANSLFGHSDNAAMFSFGEFFSLEGETSNYSVWELNLFILLGCMGGIIGACFVSSNASVFHWRRDTLQSHTARYWEAVFLTTIMTLCSVMIPVVWNRCTPLPIDMEEWSDQEKKLVEELVPLYCNSQTQYNELASLYLTDSDTAIKQLFHFREIGDHNDSTFSSSALFLFLVPYAVIACVTVGGTFPSGTFVPSLLTGATFGRLVGHLLHKLDSLRGTFADSGTYALMGAVGITAGITRLTISLTVMVLEGTGDMQYVLPLMISVMAARLVGNVFGEGLYDQHIKTRDLFYLEEDDAINLSSEYHDLIVSDVMTRTPISLLPLVRVGEVFDMMCRSKHHCFPVLDDKDGNVFYGTITRKVICTLLKHRAFGARLEDTTGEARVRTGIALSWSDLEAVYPDYPDVDTLILSESDRLCWLDLRSFIDTTAHVINEHTSILRTYRMFRTLGLRHLCVINKHNHLLGIVTRADLASVHINDDANTNVMDRSYSSASSSMASSSHHMSMSMDKSSVHSGISLSSSGADRKAPQETDRKNP